MEYMNDVQHIVNDETLYNNIRVCIKFYRLIEFKIQHSMYVPKWLIQDNLDVQKKIEYFVDAKCISCCSKKSDHTPSSASFDGCFKLSKKYFENEECNMNECTLNEAKLFLHVEQTSHSANKTISASDCNDVRT